MVPGTYWLHICAPRAYASSIERHPLYGSVIPCDIVYLRVHVLNRRATINTGKSARRNQMLASRRSFRALCSTYLYIHRLYAHTTKRRSRDLTTTQTSLLFGLAPYKEGRIQPTAVCSLAVAVDSQILILAWFVHLFRVCTYVLQSFYFLVFRFYLFQCIWVADIYIYVCLLCLRFPVRGQIASDTGLL